MLNRIAQSLLKFLRLCLRFLVSFRYISTNALPPMPSLAAAKELLVIRLDEIGDFVLTSAFLRELRHNAPPARITLVVNPSVLPLAKNCPYVNKVIAVTPKRFGDSRWALFKWKLYILWIRLTCFPVFNYDLVMLPRRGFDYYGAEFLANLCAGSGAVALCQDMVELPHLSHEFLFSTVHRFYNSHVEHEVRHNLRFLSWCGGESQSNKLEMWLTPADKAFAQDLLSKHFVGKGPLIVIHPSGGRSPLKQWPTDKFQRLILELQRLIEIHVIVVGGPDELWIRDMFPSHSADLLNLAGQLELTQLAAVLEEADLFIGCDSGPMHLAAATGIPVVSIFGSTSMVRFSPFTSCADVISLELECSPDRKGKFVDRCSACIYNEPHCLTHLTVESVLVRILTRLHDLGHQITKVDAPFLKISPPTINTQV